MKSLLKKLYQNKGQRKLKRSLSGNQMAVQIAKMGKFGQTLIIAAR